MPRSTFSIQKINMYMNAKKYYEYGHVIYIKSGPMLHNESRHIRYIEFRQITWDISYYIPTILVKGMTKLYLVHAEIMSGISYDEDDDKTDIISIISYDYEDGDVKIMSSPCSITWRSYTRSTRYSQVSYFSSPWVFSSAFLQFNMFG